MNSLSAEDQTQAMTLLLTGGDRQPELSAAEVAPDGTPLENVRLCPRCNLYDIDGKREICESCVDEINEEHPDGAWCFSTEACCWIYE